MSNPNRSSNSFVHAAALGLSLALAACSAGGGVDDGISDPGIEGETTQALEVSDLVASTSKVDFGNVRVGTRSRDAVITLRNAGRGAASVTGVRVYSADGLEPGEHNPPTYHNPPMYRLPEGAIDMRYGDFEVRMIAPCVAPQDSQTLLIGFSPTAFGPQNSRVVISYTDGGGAHELALSVSATGTR